MRVAGVFGEPEETFALGEAPVPLLEVPLEPVPEGQPLSGRLAAVDDVVGLVMVGDVVVVDVRVGDDGLQLSSCCATVRLMAGSFPRSRLTPRTCVPPPRGGNGQGDAPGAVLSRRCR